MKKGFLFIIIGIILLMSLAACSAYEDLPMSTEATNGTLEQIQVETTEINTKEFDKSELPDDALSYDGKYLARQSIEKLPEQNLKYIRIDIIDQESELIVDSFYPARASDFRGICWERDNYNLWTQSSDIGIYCYRQSGGNWECDYDAILPEYIITRYQMKDTSADSELFIQESELTSTEPETSAEIPSASDSAQIYTYEVISAVSEDMPIYRYTATGKAEGTYEWSTGFVTGLEIHDENNTSILSIDFTEEGCPIYFNMMDTMGLHVTDVNFDGYKDVIILNTFHGAHSNSWYDCWLWDAETVSFKYSQSFAEICNPAIDNDKQCIYSSSGSGAGGNSYFIYRFIDDEFVVTNNLTWGHKWIVLPEEDVPDEELYEVSGFYIIEQQLINGNLEMVHNEFYPVDDVGLVFDLYYSDDPWELNSSRWYMLGGHHADEWLE
ncbi:MAG: XAC2610-related protein [Lachnospiraceae bacterium]